jgi:hypothetical protein
MVEFLITVALVLATLFATEALITGLFGLFGVYTIVKERTCHVYVLFGRVVGIIGKPGLSFLWTRLGPAALIVNWLGKRHVLDLRLDQRYLRSLPVNSEEGAPMGIGSGMRCASVILSRSCSRTWTRTDLLLPT